MKDSSKPSQENAIKSNANHPNASGPDRSDEVDDVSFNPPEIKKEEKEDETEKRSSNLGCGIAFILVGSGLMAQNLGWIPQGDWIWPSAVIGLGIGYLYKFFRE